MPRAVFAGALSFGLVSIPVKAYPAVRSKAISFNLLCGECHSPLKYKRWCPNCECEVEQKKIERGYRISKDSFVVIGSEELERLKLKTMKTIEIRSFVDAPAIESVYYNTHYYLLPDESGAKAYSLFYHVLSLTNKAAIGKVVMHNKEHIVAVRPYRRCLMMSTLHYADEIVNVAQLGELKLGATGEQEVKLARLLIEELSGEFKPEEYRDSYREAVMKLIKQKAEGVVLPEVKPVEARATVDLMKALEASVRAIQKEKAA
jgi:DNA end-binding protein Ku